MTLPFTVEAFLEVFAAYNEAIWPFQIVAYGLGAAVAAALVAPGPTLTRLALASLGILWAFTGVGYHLLFFASINPIAPVFASVFVLQGVLFLVCAYRSGDLRQISRFNLQSVAGLLAIIYAMALYPVLGIWAGHGGMAGPMFGVAPCPLTIFTIGFLLLARGRWVIWLSAIPFLWSLIGLAAAIQLGIPEDLAMPVVGILLAGVVGRQLWQSQGMRAGPTPVPR